MKRFICMLLVVVMCASNFVLMANAQRDLARAEATASELKKLNLFQGVSEGNFDLGRAPTRIEALVMLIRVLGKEKEALNGTWRHPFTDVPSWANKYVGYAYVNGLANGQAVNRFGTGDANAAMYLTFVLRALGYSDASGGDFKWDKPFDLAKKTDILPDNVDTQKFLRADVVLVSYAALRAKIKDTEQTLADKLIAAGVFTRSQFDGILGNPQRREIAYTLLKNFVINNYTDTSDSLGYFYEEAVKTSDGTGEHIYDIFYDPEDEYITVNFVKVVYGEYMLNYYSSIDLDNTYDFASTFHSVYKDGEYESVVEGTSRVDYSKFNKGYVYQFKTFEGTNRTYYEELAKEMHNECLYFIDYIFDKYLPEFNYSTYDLGYTEYTYF